MKLRLAAVSQLPDRRPQMRSESRQDDDTSSISPKDGSERGAEEGSFRCSFLGFSVTHGGGFFVAARNEMSHYMFRSQRIHHSVICPQSCTAELLRQKPSHLQAHMLDLFYTWKLKLKFCLCITKHRGSVSFHHALWEVHTVAQLLYRPQRNILLGALRRVTNTPVKKQHLVYCTGCDAENDHIVSPRQIKRGVSWPRSLSTMVDKAWRGQLLVWALAMLVAGSVIHGASHLLHRAGASYELSISRSGERKWN